MAEDKEKKYRRISWVTSLGVQLVLLLLFYFLIAWKEPFPPIPSYGIELSFGIENVGNSPQPVTSPDPVDADESEVQETEPTEEVIEEEVVEETTEAAVEESVESEAETTEVPVTNQPSPDVVEEKKEPVKEKPKEEPKKEKVEEKKPTPKPETETKPETQEVNEEAVMPKSEKGEKNDSSGENDKEGREGKKDGDIDGRALMGEQGSSTGASLNMAGWAWDQKPQPKDDSSEEGKIVFKIKVDDEGYLVGIEKIFSNVSPSVELYYKQSVERLTFTPTSSSAPAPISEGTITFIIRTK